MNLQYSETFYSPQGEGAYVGIPSLWMRFFLCNLQCNGFGQDDPTNPDSWELPYEEIDISRIKVVEELPTSKKGEVTHGQNIRLISRLTAQRGCR